MVWKYSVLLSYLGTTFCGWQRQKVTEKESIQATIEKALLQMTGEETSVVGSGRTDSGVHAVGQVAHFVMKKKEWDPRILHRGLNGILRPNIQVLAVQAVPMDFHAQRSALRKQYSYYFQQGPCALPHLEPISWWIHKRLDTEAMSEAIRHLVGEHDFKPFQARGAKPGPTVRTVLEADVKRIPLSFPDGIREGSNGAMAQLSSVRIRIVGTGFLKQMVRGIAGTLLQVGEGRRPPSCLAEILKSGDRSEVGPTAPARALWLDQVWYDPALRLWSVE